MLTRKATQAHRASASRRTTLTRRPLRVSAFFWKQDPAKEEEKRAAWEAQQEVLRKRRDGSAIQEAYERRRKVKETVQERQRLRQEEKDQLAQGIMPETLKNWKPYQKKEDAEASSGIVVPLLPFGIRQYDEGERFDLRSPYADDGWVDPEETDMFAGIKNAGKKLLNFSGKEPESQIGKPIMFTNFGRNKKLGKGNSNNAESQQ